MLLWLSSRPCIRGSPSHISDLAIIRKLQDARLVKQGDNRLRLTDIHPSHQELC